MMNNRVVDIAINNSKLFYRSFNDIKDEFKLSNNYECGKLITYLKKSGYLYEVKGYTDGREYIRYMLNPNLWNKPYKTDLFQQILSK